MIVLTGFEKFSRYKINLSEFLVNQFEDRIMNNQIRKIILPVSWKRSISYYKNKISNLDQLPILVILLGIHSGPEVRIERYSWNVSIGLDEDNKFKLSPIKIIAKIRIKMALNLKNITSINTRGPKVMFSNYMGTYLCNYLYFNAMLIAAERYPVVFIHIPDHGNLRELKITLKQIIFLAIKTMKQNIS
jgi:pyrrolidone-carboxylate peptidase